MRQMTARQLTFCYVIALSVIAVLSIGSHFVLARTLEANAGSAAIINMSGRQRMLSQRIVATALELQAGDATAREPLRRAIDLFAASHQKLVALAQSNDKDRVAVARLRDTYFGVVNSDGQTRQFIAAADRIWARPAQRTDLTGHKHAHYGQDMATLVDLSRGPLLDSLDQVVSIHQAENETRTAQLEMIQWSILGIVLATLAIEALFVFRPMIARLASYIKQLLELADIDYLTGVANRRAFTARATSEIQRSLRYNRNCTLLIVDVDHFKRINDTHGHLVGDAALVALAQILDRNARQEDILGRIGGEEFAVFLPETTLSQASVVAERIRKAVAASVINANATDIDMTISIGMAAVPLEAADPLKTALSVADRMLYQAKDAGRNCVWPVLTAVTVLAAV